MPSSARSTRTSALSLKLGSIGTIVGAINSGLSIPIQKILLPPVFVSSPSAQLFLNGAQSKRYGSDVTNVSDFVGQKITVNGYGYRDVVNLGIDGTTGAIGTASQISGTVQVRNFGGGPGLTTLNVDDSADTAVRDVQIRDASIVGLGPAVITYDPKDLLALNIVGTRGFIPGAFVGRLASPCAREHL